MHVARRSFLSLLLLGALLGLLAAGCGGSSDDAKGDSATKQAGANEAQGEDEGADPEAVGEAYQEAVLPHIAALKPLLERMNTTADKLTQGTIDTARAAEAFAKQAGTARELAAQVRAVEVDDEHLSEANEHLAKAVDAYGDGMDVYATFNDGMNDSEVQATLDRGMGHLNQMLTSLDAWATALIDDPEGRSFERLANKVIEVGEYVENL